MKGNKKILKIAYLISIPVLFAAGMLVFYFQAYQVEPAFSEVVYEYGQDISKDLEDYLVGSGWSVRLAELDLSEVDENHIGTYSATVFHGKKEYTYTIVIQDTTAPEIQLKKGRVYLPLNRDCLIEDVVEKVEDEDVHATAYFCQGKELLETLCFSEPGEYTLQLVAKDCSGNEAETEITVCVDSPPVISGVQRYFLVPGSYPDFSGVVQAYDEVDGDLTALLTVDDSLVELSEEGEYVLRYEAEDSYGLKTVAETTVLVAEPEEIQALIGVREIDYRVDVIMGAPNIYDAGVSEEDNLTETLEYMRPTLVHLYHATERGGYSSGSGYIMEITEEKIYICTNRHVVKKFDNWDIYFFDGSKVPGKALGAVEGYDVGVAVVETEDVPKALLEQLMTVHIDISLWETLDEQTITLGLERLDREGGLIHVAEGELVKVKQDFEWYERLEHTEVTVQLVHGDSGSAVLDGYGNLICMAYAYSTEPVRYWCVPLDEILACYREITGRMPYVY